ncbi:MAG: hypothetical protein IKQ40_06880 [Lachnospiraceae bacterium]|nr:hypothetical protein [Lachnospiraceae bacterium]
MKNIDWHNGFVSAMKLELTENERNLTYETEHHIANRAQRIDLVIIRKNDNVEIHNPIGERFSRFNICEYKSPGQPLTYADFYKVLAYTCLYLYETQSPSFHNAHDYTMTFVREAHPRSLFKCLATDGIKISIVKQGIYELADTIMNIFTTANRELVKAQLKEPEMCKAVDELFAEIHAEQIKEMEKQIADKDAELSNIKAENAQLKAQNKRLLAERTQ